MGITLSKAAANPLQPDTRLYFSPAVPSDLRNKLPVLEFYIDRQDRIGSIMDLDHPVQTIKIR